MARFASRGASGGLDLRHTFTELSTMRVRVTCGARKIREVVRNRSFRFQSIVHAVAIAASNGDMRAREPKRCLIMLRRSKGRGAVAFQVVATLALVLIGRPGKLRPVRIGVAIQAGGELDFEKSGGSFGNMALCAGDCCVFLDQWELRAGMFRNAKTRRLEPFHGMARSTFAGIRPFAELSVMRIGLVAIRASRKRHRPLEVRTGMARSASDRRMFSRQRELRSRVVKAANRRDLLPSGGRMARRTGLPERASMRIGVAGHAGVELQPGVLRRFARAARVALRTPNGFVLPRQGKLRLAMIE